ncbi:hypothetical protein ACS0TY_011694 [Phlomoides rotata]
MILLCLLAGVGYNPSFTWCSILDGCGVLETGLLWIVGNGSSIRIWEDPWLVDGGSSFIPCERIVMEGVERVSDLLDFHAGNWDVPRLNALFLGSVVKRIRSLLECSLDSPDELTWKFTKNGIYSTKSGFLGKGEGWETAGAVLRLSLEYLVFPEPADIRAKLSIPRTGVQVCLDTCGGFLPCAEYCYDRVSRVASCSTSGVEELVVESNSLLLISALTKDRPDLSYFGRLVRRTLQLSESFMRVFFSWTRRTGNVVAHRLAQFTFSCENDFFDSVVPETLVPVVLSDALAI